MRTNNVIHIPRQNSEVPIEVSSGVTYTPISSLTVGLASSGQAKQVYLSPAWKKVDSGRYRSNCTGSAVTVYVTGTQKFGLVLSRGCYSAANASGVQQTIVPGYWAAQQWPGGFTYGIAPGIEESGTWLYTAMTPASSYIIRAEPVLFPWSHPETFAFETMRDVDTGGTEHGEFWDLIGFIHDTGTTFNATAIAVPTKKFLILGDSINSGSVSGGTTVAHRSAATYFLNAYTFPPGSFTVASGQSSWNQKGYHGGFAYKLISSFVSTTKWAEVVNLSRPGQWEGEMGPLVRILHTLTVPGLYPDYVDRFYRRQTGDEDFTDAGDWTGGWTPDVVILTSFANDMLQAVTERAYGFLTGNEAYFTGTAIRDSIGARSGSLMSAILAKWPNVKFLIVNSSMTDAANSAYWGISPALDTKARIAAAFDGTDDVGHFDFTTGGTDYSYGYYADMASMSLGTGSNFASVHFSETVHDAVRSALQTEFNRICNL